MAGGRSDAPGGIPAGVWAVASGLSGLEAAQRWAEEASAAAAMTFRRPACGEGEAVAAARCLRGRTRFLAVHGRGDWAAAAGADAVVAGAASLPPGALRRAFPGLLLGCSVHDENEIQAARAAGADFLIYGPVWETPGKAGVLSPRGLRGLEAACRCGTPVVAIGGILEPDQVRACRAAGAHAAAVLRAARSREGLGPLTGIWPASLRK